MGSKGDYSGRGLRFLRGRVFGHFCKGLYKNLCGVENGEELGVEEWMTCARERELRDLNV